MSKVGFLEITDLVIPPASSPLISPSLLLPNTHPTPTLALRYSKGEGVKVWDGRDALDLLAPGVASSFGRPSGDSFIGASGERGGKMGRSGVGRGGKGEGWRGERERG